MLSSGAGDTSVKMKFPLVLLTTLLLGVASVSGEERQMYVYLYVRVASLLSLRFLSYGHRQPQCETFLNPKHL